MPQAPLTLFSELVASLDADPGVRGRQFEVFVKWFLQNDPVWAAQVDQVWLWRDYPQRWGADCGIDLVFRHKNGEIWSVQAKCYAPTYDISRPDVNKFLSESNRKGIDKCLLIATTDRIGFNARQVCDAQQKKVVRYLRANFESANVDYPATFSALHTAKAKTRPQPFPHQAEAITAVGARLCNTDRGQLIMACGTGKTFTTLWIKEHLAAESTLVLLPSLGLLSQTLNEWKLAANTPFEVLCVCSDATVGKRGDEDGDRIIDETIHCVADLAFPVTSETSEIKAFFQRTGPRVVFSTYQSSPLLAEVQADITISSFDLVVADEAHRCAGKAGSDFSTVLDATRIRATKRLFTTATPRTYSSVIKKAAGERGVEVVGMDDVAVFGEVLFSLPFGEAIKRGLLTDYRVVIIGVDSPTIAQWIENRELLKTHSGIEIDAESLAAQIGVLKAFKDYDLHRVISFHSRVNRAEAFTQDLQQVMHWVDAAHKPSGTLITDFVSGAMPTDQRRRKLAQLKALAPQERGLLANARCLSEGVDVPSLDGVAFIDPRSSQIDIIQAVGRAIRLSANKTLGTIVLPVFIEQADSPAACIEASNFKPIWEVLNALKAHDDVLAAELDQLRTALGRKLGTSLGTGALSKINFDLPASVDQSFGAALRTQVVEQLTDSWEFWYGLLQGYAEEHGDCLVNQDLKLSNGYALGSWVGTQRAAKEKLAIVRKAKLEALAGWSWKPHDDKWEIGFQHLTDYAAEIGDCFVPHSFKLADGYFLGSWLANQKFNEERLPSDRRTRLESIPGWSWDPVDQWEIGFQHLQNYFAAHGNCLVFRSFKLGDGYSLGQWVSTQRDRFKSLTSERRLRLESLPGWSFDPHSARWSTGYQHLREYFETSGNCFVARDFKTPNGFPLGQWIRTQRARKKFHSPNRLAKLEAIAGWSWNVIDEQWEIGFRSLKNYSETHGDCTAPKSFVLPNGNSLGLWVGVQRIGKDRLSVEKKSRLESLSGWTWNPIDDQWEAGFLHLISYANEHGDCWVPSNFELANGYKFGSWVLRQRSFEVNHTPERKARLEALAGWSWNTNVDRWETGIRHLTDYESLHGDCLVPSALKLIDGYKLGSWVIVQRSNKESMTLQRRERLETLAGWAWNSLDEKWETGFQNLAEYAAQNGDCLVPKNAIQANGFQLGVWVNKQRSKKLGTSPERVARLVSLPGWSWNTLADTWDTRFDELKIFSTKHGHCAVPLKLNAVNGNKLSTWVSAQRSGRDNQSADKRAKLASLAGWSWDIRGDNWEVRFGYLTTYVAEQGDCLVPVACKLPNGFKLGQWINIQRTHKAEMSVDRITRLEGLKGWSWNARVDQWEAGFRQLEAFAAVHGHCLPALSFKTSDDYSLGAWVVAQRSQKSDLSSDRIQRLESLPGWSWNTRVDQWETGHQHLKDYVAKHGTCLVPKSFKLPDGYTLGGWVNKQRSRKSELSSERLARLESIPGWAWRAGEERWETGFKYLQAYVTKHGHGKPPRSFVAPDGYKLGVWIGGQSSKKSRLSSEQIIALESLPGWTWRTPKLLQN